MLGPDGTEMTGFSLGEAGMGERGGRADTEMTGNDLASKNLERWEVIDPSTSSPLRGGKNFFSERGRQCLYS